MLVLSRKPGQRITILGNIEVTVLEVTRDGVKLGVKAPSVVPVYRTELLDSVRAQNLKAAGCAADPAGAAAAVSALKPARAAAPGVN